jgi:putative ABC transport system substrate-binding protein
MKLRRREFITLIGGAAAAWPLAARAQQPVMPVIGFLGSDIKFMQTTSFHSFQQGLAEAGYVDGHNVAIEYLWSEGHVERFPELVANLVSHRVAVIAAEAGIPAAAAAKSATTTIPIVFQGGFDPVETRLVASLNRPGGNLTGVTTLGLELGPKRLEVMHQLMPVAKVFALLINPEHPNAASQSRDMQTAARALGLQVSILNARAMTEFDEAFVQVAKAGADALVVGIGQPFTNNDRRLAELAVRHRVPAISGEREFVEGGGLVSYGGGSVEVHRLYGLYIGRILKGERPADLPVQQATKVELFINLRTAKALGITVPLSLLTRADEVIE